MEKPEKAGLISEKKFNNLQKNNVDDILTKGFINRQLVETRQIVKSVANLILDYYNEQIDVIEVKASLSTSVRKMLTYEKKIIMGSGKKIKIIVCSIKIGI